MGLAFIWGVSMIWRMNPEPRVVGLWASLVLLALLALMVLAPGCAPKPLPPAPPAPLPEVVVPAGPTAEDIRAELMARVVQAAKNQIGRPYKPGGSSPKAGFDCSGLIWWAYSQAGMELPRRSQEQAVAGRGVEEPMLLPGDLIIFQIEDEVEALHMGLFTGERMFLHSPSSGGAVREDSLDAPFWLERYQGARRVPE